MKIAVEKRPKYKLLAAAISTAVFGFSGHALAEE